MLDAPVPTVDARHAIARIRIASQPVEHTAEDVAEALGHATTCTDSGPCAALLGLVAVVAVLVLVAVFGGVLVALRLAGGRERVDPASDGARRVGVRVVGGEEHQQEDGGHNG